MAAALARRFTRPVVAAVDHHAASPPATSTPGWRSGRDEDPEFAQLAESINAMGGNLARARDQERQFLMSVSHELRTPLTSIRGYADAVLDGATDDPHAAAAVISGEAQRLERLVQDLLDLARLDADRFTFDLRTVDAAAVVRQVVGGLPAPGGGAGHRARRSHRAPTRPARCGPTTTDSAQVVANLVENAASLRRAPGDWWACPVARTAPCSGWTTTARASRPTS